MKCYLFIALVCFVGSAWAQSCHLRELDLCAATLLVFTQNPSDAGTEAEIERQCGAIKEARECRQNYTSKCTTPLQRDLVNLLSAGAERAADEFCSPGSELREEYKKYAKCIAENRQNQRRCTKDLQAALEVVTSTTWDQRITAACCAFNRFDECSEANLLERCGEDAVKFSRKMVRVTASRLPEIICKAYPAESKRCTNLLPSPGTAPSGAKTNSLISRIFSTYAGSN